MKKYKFEAQGKTKTIQKWKPPGEKRDGTILPGQWINYQFFGKWEHAVASIVNAELIPIGDELREQLENFPKALDNAVQEIMSSLEIDNS